MSDEELRNEITLIRADNLFTGLSLEQISKIPKQRLKELETETDQLMQLIKGRDTKRDAYVIGGDSERPGGVDQTCAHLLIKEQRQRAKEWNSNDQ